MPRDDEHDRLTAAFCDAAARYVGPNYFRTRRLEFALQRMLLPHLFCDRYDRVLELGCGIGFKALLMSEFAEHVDAIDIDQPYHGFRANTSSVDIGRELFEEVGSNRIQLAVGDFSAFMNERPSQYDVVYSDYLFEHVPDLPPLCDAMRTALRPGGVALHILPNTHDALIQLAQENLQPTFRALKKVAKAGIKHAFNGIRRRPKMTAAGYFVPETHSEFISDFRDQFEVYRMENYVFPMIEAGFRIDDIVPIREHSLCISCTKEK